MFALFFSIRFGHVIRERQAISLSINFCCIYNQHCNLFRTCIYAVYCFGILRRKDLWNHFFLRKFFFLPIRIANWRIFRAKFHGTFETNDGSEKKSRGFAVFFSFMQEKSIFRLMHSTGINFFILKCISMLFRQIVGLHSFSPQGWIYNAQVSTHWILCWDAKNWHPLHTFVSLFSVCRFLAYKHVSFAKVSLNWKLHQKEMSMHACMQ